MRCLTPLVMALAMAIGGASAAGSAIAAGASGLNEFASQGPQPEKVFQRRSARASAGHPDVLLYRGLLLHHGLGTPVDQKAAYQYFLQAAQAGNPLASFMVGDYLLGRNPKVVAPDQDQALSHLLKAADAGYDEAQWLVAKLHVARGEKDAAIPWLERASRQGHADALIELISLKRKPGRIRGEDLGFMMLLLKLSEKPDAQDKQFVEMLYQLSDPDDRAAADEIRNGWITGPTKLTHRARAMPAIVQAVQAEIEKRQADQSGG